MSGMQWAPFPFPKEKAPVFPPFSPVGGKGKVKGRGNRGYKRRKADESRGPTPTGLIFPPALSPEVVGPLWGTTFSSSGGNTRFFPP